MADLDLAVGCLAAAGHRTREGAGSTFLDPDGWILVLSDRGETALADRSDAALSQFRVAAIDWAAGGRGQPLVDAAAQALADGLDSPALRVLAGAPGASADDEARELAPSVFDELGLEIPERMSEAAQVAAAVLVGRRFLDGQGTAREVVRRLNATFVSAGYPDELADFSALDDLYDLLEAGVITGTIADIDHSTVARVQHLCSPGALDKRPDIAGLLRRSFLAGEVTTE